MPRPRLFYACLLPLLLCGGLARAHQVPNMTVEAAFASEGKYELKVNLDPRVFLSNIPTSLPPVSADWYLNQTEEQVRQSYAQATEHVKKHLEMRLGGQAAPFPDISWQAMDGATNQPLTRETAEAHLLGTIQGPVPAGRGIFGLAFAKEAVVSLILLLKTPEMPEPKVQVLFPGESSREIQVPAEPTAAAPVIASVAQPQAASDQPRETGWTGWVWLAGSGAALVLGWLVVTRRKR